MGHPVPHLDIDGVGFVAVQQNPVLEGQHLVAALGVAGFVHEFALHLQLRIHAEADGERLADGHERHLRLADEIHAEVHCGFAGQQNVVGRVDQVREPVNVRGEDWDRLVVEPWRHIEFGNFEDLVVVAGRQRQFRFEVIGHTRAAVENVADRVAFGNLLFAS